MIGFSHFVSCSEMRTCSDKAMFCSKHLSTGMRLPDDFLEDEGACRAYAEGTRVHELESALSAGLSETVRSSSCDGLPVF